ncbi:MAG: chitobiase/beta-hexosaminidase C-terminal domain-containing protein [Candidatus Obscuribacterales bacterium]|nr:chitobiase/beta-hexosaminidase C-terminal domain-containing protein [Candidatus Obscuribacterales bacterium]
MPQDFALNSDRFDDAKLELRKLRSFSCQYHLSAKLFFLVPLVIAAFTYSTLKASATEAAPSIVPNFQVFSSGPQTVSISDTDGSAVIHYTTDGTTVTTSSPTYSAPFPVSVTTTIQALAVGSGGTSPITTTVVQIDPSTANIPRSGLLTWQKSDLGLTISGSSVTAWADASGNGYNLTTNTGATNPTYHPNAVNGLPAVTYDGVANSSIWPAGFANLTAGCSVFVNYHPIGRSSGEILCLSNGGTGDSLNIWPFWNAGKPLYFFVNGPGGSTNFTSTYYLGQYQTLSFIHNGLSTGSYYIDGQLMNQSTTLSSFANVTRANNFIGGGYYGTFFNCDYTEILIYNRPVTTTEFANIQAYLTSRYLGPTASAPVAPVFNLAAGTLAAPTELGISTAPGAVTHFTVDGTTPSATSPVLTSAVQINYSQIVQAISIQNGLSSSVTSASFVLNSTNYPAPSVTDTSTLQINLQSPSPAQ